MLLTKFRKNNKENSYLVDNRINEEFFHETKNIELFQIKKKLQENSREERIKIGVELHDNLGKDLLEILLSIGNLNNRLKEKGLQEALVAEKLERDVIKMIKKSRNLANGFFSESEEETDFYTIIKKIKFNLIENHRINCKTEIDELILANNFVISVNLYYIIQEAVKNIIKHANAKNVVVRATHIDEFIILKIKDDGVGISSKINNGDGIGIEIMKYRAKQIGAALEIKRKKSGGTELVCIFEP